MIQVHFPGSFSNLNRRSLLRVASVVTLFSLVCLILPGLQSQVKAQNAPGISSVEKQIEADLNAGEFAHAMKTALTVENPAKRSKLLKQIASAQQESGDFSATFASIRRIPDSSIRTQKRSELIRKKSSQAGGGAGGGGAAISELVDLIQEVTGNEGTWSGDDDDFEEGGGSIIPWSESANTGVLVDPRGVLQQSTSKEKGKRLASLSDQVRKADLNKDMARSSSLRLVSLTRLEKLIAQNKKEGKPVYTTMKQLAGLTRVQYIFVYPEENEIVIGGPAEAWQVNSAGQLVGVDSGRPVLHLDDLVTVLRTFSDNGKAFFNCLIVPREEHIRKLHAYVTKTGGGSRSPAATKSWVNRLENILGTQDVVYNGIPVDSRVARTIIEADYRMKLIGIDKLQRADIPSYFDLLTKEDQKGAQMVDALRWWLTMNYDSVLHSADENTFEIKGSSVQCQSENELITKEGQRISTGKANVTNQMFADEFTAKYNELASEDPVFADLQNVFDLSLVAALIKKYNLDDKADWSHGAFSRDGQYHPASYTVVKTAQSVANHRVYNKRNVIIQVAGGVKGDLMSVVSDTKVVKESPTKLVDRPKLPEGRWWWDVSSN